MSSNQRTAFRRAITSLPIGELHHGDCMGADEEAHDIARAYGWTIVIHPPSDDSWRAWSIGDLVLVAKPYITRNHDIVDAADQLYAAPDSEQERMRSGTWSTIRYARLKNKPVVLLGR